MDEFAKKYIFLGGLQKRVVNTLFTLLQVSEDMTGIIKITKRFEADGSKKKSNDLSQQCSLSRNIPQVKEHKKFGPSNQHKGQAEGITSYKRRNLEHHPMLETKEVT